MTCNLWVILASDILLSAHPMLYPEKSMVNMMESSLTETMVSNTGNMYDPMVSTLLRYYTKHATASSDQTSSCILLLCSPKYSLIFAGYLHSLQLKFSYHPAFIHLFQKVFVFLSASSCILVWSCSTFQHTNISLICKTSAKMCECISDKKFTLFFSFLCILTDVIRIERWIKPNFRVLSTFITQTLPSTDCFWWN